MDSLAFLLESDSMCIALAVLENKLIIVANEFFEKSNIQKNKKIKFIHQVFHYLLNIINSKNN